ncbi:MAG: hypothetical protein LBT24_07700, partial [Tannerella sp.]|nr:hypothetical protein [Tannerella sp.]
MKDFLIFCFALLMFTGVTGFSAQAEGNDEASLLLDLKKARANYEAAKQKYDNDQRLYDEKAIAENEFNKSKNALLSNEVDYQKLILQLISHQSYVIVGEAIKYQSANGNRRVKITLKSASEGNAAYLEQFKEHFDVFSPEMRSGKIYNIFVSIMDMTDKTIIGSPYEYHIPAMDVGGEATADFDLLKDVESLQVVLNYNNKQNEKNIYLKKDASVNVIDISSMQFSQEADLSSSATYNLSLERFSTSDDVYRLVVLNLPKQISYDFTDESSKVSQIKFAQGVNTKKISLKVYLPDRDDEQVKIDEAIKFHVAALTNDEYTKLSGADWTNMPPSQMAQLSAGSEALEIIPRGKGKIEVRATSLYHETHPGDSIYMEVTVRNAGSRRLDNIKITADSPIGWNIKLIPDLIRSLNSEKEQQVRIVIIPPVDGGVGAQEVKIKTEALADNRKVDTEDKTIRIQVNAQTSVWGTVLLITLLIGLLV